MVQEGKFDHIGLSEVRAETIRRAYKVMPVVAAEIEISLQAYEPQTKDGECCDCHCRKELDIATNGFTLKTVIPGICSTVSRMIILDTQPVDALSTLAHRKGITLARLCIVWVSAFGDHVIPLLGSSNVKCTLENRPAGEVEMSTEDLAEIGLLLEKYPGKGGRYIDAQLNLWN